ncbi:MAG: chemotaxis protein CheW [Spirochaetota bacterium]
MESLINKKNASAAEQRKYIAFKLGDELYAVNVMNAQEVMGMIPIGHVPDTQPYMKGVIDLRGTIVPIVDLRVKYGMEEKAYNDDTAIMITEMHNELVGLVVDSVVDVLQLSIEDIQHTPHFTAKADRDSVEGIGKVNDEIIIVLEANRMLSADEMKGLAQANI